MQVKGKLSKILPEVFGKSQNGNDWHKQEFIINTGKEFNAEICITAFGDLIEILKKIPINTFIEVSINLYSKNYKENKYFNNISAYKIEIIDQTEEIENPF